MRSKTSKSEKKASFPKKDERVCSEPQMKVWAGELSRRCNPGDVVFLDGELGAGKTTWVRAMLLEQGCSQTVHSPSFSILNEYQLHGHLWVHADVYRLNHEQELFEVGLENRMGAADGVVLIEWASKFPQWKSTLIAKRALRGFEVAIDFASEEGLRRITVTQLEASTRTRVPTA